MRTESLWPWYAAFQSPRLTMTPSRDVDWWCGEMYVRTMVRWLNDPEVVQFSQQRHTHHTELTQYLYLEECIPQKGKGYWAIFLNDPRRLIGGVTVSVMENDKTINLGIMIGDKTVWGCGYGKEVWKAAMRHFFSHGYDKVEAGMMACNVPMIRTAEACGMQVEGQIKGHFLWQGRRMDMVLMGATP